MQVIASLGEDREAVWCTDHDQQERYAKKAGMFPHQAIQDAGLGHLQLSPKMPMVVNTVDSG